MSAFWLAVEGNDASIFLIAISFFILFSCFCALEIYISHQCIAPNGSKQPLTVMRHHPPTFDRAVTFSFPCSQTSKKTLRDHQNSSIFKLLKATPQEVNKGKGKFTYWLRTEMLNSCKQLSQYFFETWLTVSIWKYITVNGFFS